MIIRPLLLESFDGFANQRDHHCFAIEKRNRERKKFAHSSPPNFERHNEAGAFWLRAGTSPIETRWATAG